MSDARRFDTAEELLAFLATLDMTPDPNLSTASGVTDPYLTDEQIIADLLYKMSLNNMIVTTVDNKVTVQVIPRQQGADGDAVSTVINLPSTRLNSTQLMSLFTQGTLIEVPSSEIAATSDGKWAKNSTPIIYTGRAWLSYAPKPSVTVSTNNVISLLCEGNVPILYSLDGTTPSIRYAGPFTHVGGGTLKFRVSIGTYLGTIYSKVINNWIFADYSNPDIWTSYFNPTYMSTWVHNGTAFVPNNSAYIEFRTTQAITIPPASSSPYDSAILIQCSSAYNNVYIKAFSHLTGLFEVVQGIKVDSGWLFDMDLRKYVLSRFQVYNCDVITGIHIACNVPANRTYTPAVISFGDAIYEVPDVNQQAYHVPFSITGFPGSGVALNYEFYYICDADDWIIMTPLFYSPFTLLTTNGSTSEYTSYWQTSSDHGHWEFQGETQHPLTHIRIVIVITETDSIGMVMKVTRYMQDFHYGDA